jgi:hypothetical protein
MNDTETAADLLEQLIAISEDISTLTARQGREWARCLAMVRKLEEDASKKDPKARQDDDWGSEAQFGPAP